MAHGRDCGAILGRHELSAAPADDSPILVMLTDDPGVTFRLQLCVAEGIEVRCKAIRSRHRCLPVLPVSGVCSRIAGAYSGQDDPGRCTPIAADAQGHHRNMEDVGGSRAASGFRIYLGEYKLTFDTILLTSGKADATTGSRP